MSLGSQLCRAGERYSGYKILLNPEFVIGYSRQGSSSFIRAVVCMCLVDLLYVT